MDKSKKVFLSKDIDERGNLSWYVTLEDSDYSFSSYLDAELQIADCHRTITLDFACGREKDIDKRLKKVDTIISELYEFRDALEACKSKPKKFYY